MYVMCSYVLVQQLILGHILWVKGTGYDEFPLHGSSIYHLHHVDKILRGLEAADKLGVVSSAAEREGGREGGRERGREEL